MGGKILEYEAKTILREGMAQGRREGRREGIAIGRDQERQIIMNRLIASDMQPGQAAAITGLSV